jgi:hypothetical protein
MLDPRPWTNFLQGSNPICGEGLESECTMLSSTKRTVRRCYSSVVALSVSLSDTAPSDLGYDPGGAAFCVRTTLRAADVRTIVGVGRCV